MKAAVMTHFREPLTIRQLPDPEPGRADAIIRVEACGVCRSDWHVWQEDLSWVGIKVDLPRVPGHEFGGVIEEVGSDVRGFRPGDRVTVPFHLSCGECQYCRSGRGNLCLAYGVIGVHHDGGYGNLALVPLADVNLVRLPDGVDASTAAALGCRFMTAYHGIVDRARVRPGEWVVIFGMGGVGLAAVQIAAALGARVVAVSRGEENLAQAKREGAVATVQVDDQIITAVKDITGGGAEVSVDALGSSRTAVPAVFCLRKGGRHLQLGLTGKDDQGMIGLPVDAMTLQEIQFIGSLGCPTTSYPGLLSMVESSQLNPNRLVERTIAVEEVNTVLSAMTDYRTHGFNVITSWS